MKRVKTYTVKRKHKNITKENLEDNNWAITFPNSSQQDFVEIVIQVL